MNDVQQKLLIMMKDIEAAIKGTPLRYSISSGTALGWVRNKTFIPWDDDLDYEVYFEDYDEFIRILRKKLPSRYKVFEGGKDGDGACSYAKVFDKKTHIKSPSNDNKILMNYLFVDIFKIMPVNSKNVTEYKRALGKLGFKYGSFNWFINSLFFVPRLLIKKRNNMDVINKFEKEKPNPNGSYWTDNWFGKKPWSAYKRGHDFTMKKIKFEGVETSIWTQHNAYLSSLYGEDFMTPPKRKENHGISLK